MFSFLLQAILVFLLHHSNCSIVRNIKCAVPNDPDNGKAVYESLDVGSELYYECNKGFFLSNDFVRECTKDGLWNGEEGFCQEKCRDAPPPLRNAYIEHFENEHNGVVVYKCNSFFSLEDNGSIACNSGVWKGKLPVCKDTRCYMRSFSDTPGLLVDEKKIFYSGQSFTPQCYDSYEVSKQRDGKIYCYNGEWTGNIPPCKETSCTEPPPEPVNGKAIKYTGENGTSVVYRCDDSFIMEQYSVVECLYGNWEGTPPVCKDTRCYLKDLRYNEGVHLEDDSPTMPNENASLTCEEGYIMTFSPPTCLRGEWKNRHQFSPCQQADCKVETIDNGVTKVLRRNVEERPNIKLEEDDFIVIDVESWKKSGDNAFVFCKPSHTFHGRGDPGYAKITCEKGKWRPLPSCLLRPCRTPSVSNGRFGNYATSRYNSRKSFKTVYEGTVTDDGTEFVWMCNINYEAPGNGERKNKVVCENGTWSKDIQCVPARCRSPPPEMQNAYVESFEDAHGGTVSYKCNQFFKRIRPSKVVCHFGTWTGSTGECRDTRCNVDLLDQIPGLVNVHEQQNVPSGYSFLPSCDGNHQRSETDHGTISCEEGQWEGNPSPCVPESCTTHRAPEPEHGKSRPYQHRHGSTVQYDCDDGYYKTQEGNVNCQYGVWTGNPPGCEISRNCQVPFVQNGFIGKYGRTRQTTKSFIKAFPNTNVNFGEEYVLKCNKGFEASGQRDGETTVVCRNGGWFPQIQCTPELDRCLDPGVSPTGSRAGDCCYRGDTLRFQCHNDTQLVGEEEISCLPGGRWSSPRPRCEPLDFHCDDPPEIAHGRVTWRPGSKSRDFFIPYEQVSVICDPGFSVAEGSDFLLCDDDGWDDTFATCEASTCGMPNIPENGTIVELVSTNSKSFPYQFEITYECDPGFGLIGNRWRICDSSGWSGQSPYCQDYSQCGLGLQRIAGKKRVKRDSTHARIMGGKKVIEPWPWMAAIYVMDHHIRGSSQQLTCGGSVVGEKWILTTAHCLFEKVRKRRNVLDVIVKLGLVSVENVMTTVETYGVDEFVIHEEYNSTTFDYDIALLKLSRNIEFSAFVTPICLPPADLSNDTSLYRPKEFGFVAGWGYDKVLKEGEDATYNVPHLKELKLQIRSRKTCRDSLKERKEKQFIFTERMFCVGSGLGEVDTCKGDSGGPLMQSQLSKEGFVYWVQIGVVSWGIGCGQMHTYGFYTHVHYFLNWIQERIS